MGKNNYFNEVHENAIAEYCKSDDIAYRNELYTKYIDSCLTELIDNLVGTKKYNFWMFPNIEDKKVDCKIYIATKLDKFDPDRGKKAFSYFTVAVKNWFFNEARKDSRRDKRFYYFDSENDEFLSNDDLSYNYKQEMIDEIELRDFLISSFEEMEREEIYKQFYKINKDGFCKDIFDTFFDIVKGEEEVDLEFRKIKRHIIEKHGLSNKRANTIFEIIRDYYKQFLRQNYFDDDCRED